MADVQWNMLSCEHGNIAAVVSKDSLIRICYECSADDVSSSIKRFYPDAKQSSHWLVAESLKQLSEYFLGKRRTFTIPLGNDALSAFTRRVQQALIRVPYGSVVSYGELAKMAGSPGAARAVGGVMSSNPWPLIVPCHRVVHADGRIGNYSAAQGSRTKAWLIAFEHRLSSE